VRRGWAQGKRWRSQADRQRRLTETDGTGAFQQALSGRAAAGPTRALQQALSGRVALITGASGGIGQALASRLAAEGAATVLAYGASAAPAEALATEIRAAGGRAAAIGADLRDADAPTVLAQLAEETFGPVEVLVCNAGLGRQQTLEEVSSADFDEMLAVNLRAPFLLAQRVVPAMRERGYGRILFMSSVAAFTGGIVGPHYAASKAGLHGLTHFLAARLAPAGITVNALAPALIAETGMLPGDPGQLASRIPVGRLGAPAEVADLAMAILANPYLTSQVISLDGGMHPR
jgi:3-oxoacyl-[acyl-carrier protein] reductase